MRLFVALSVVLLAATAFASPEITVPLTKLQRTGAYLKGAANADRARAKYLKSRTPSGPTTVPATNLAYSIYTTRVGIGCPQTYYNLIVDTGSSITWCGAGNSYVRTPTSIDTGEAVNVTYGSGNMTGEEYLDQVTLAPNVMLKNQSIGGALCSYGFGGFDGILGFGPVDLTKRTLTHDTNATIPTAMNNLVSQGVIQNLTLDGALTYGGADSSLYEGEVTYVPLTDTYPAAYYWGVNVTCVTYGNYTVIPNSTAGIVDSGTTLVLFADDFFSVYVDTIPGALWNSTICALQIPLASIPSMQPLNFTMADRVFTMDVAAQLIPRDENTALGGVPGIQYGWVSNMGTFSREGFDFILGMAFLERHYAVFDMDNKRLGLALRNNTFTTYQG